LPITYDVANNTIIVTGYTEASPCTFNDLWNADKAGTLSLHARTGINAVDANPVNLARNLRPADEVLMGGAKQDLYIIITNWSNMTSATIRLIGTNENGGALTEDIVVNGNGTYYASKLFKTLTQSQVTVFTKSDSGSFSYEVLQGQSGVVWKIGSSQFKFDCKIQMGDGSTPTYFTDKSKSVSWEQPADAWTCIKVKAQATVTFGNLVNLTRKSTDQGVHFLLSFGWGYAQIDADVNSTVYFYSCSVVASGGVGRIGGAGVMRIWNFQANRTSLTLIPAGSNLYNVYLGNVAGDFACTLLTGTMDKLATIECLYSQYLCANVTISNLDAQGHTTFAMVEGASLYKVYLINVTVDSWTFAFTAGSDTIVYRQYTFDLKVTDKDNNPINGATVTLKDKGGNQIFSVNTDANGNIATQTASRGYYDQAHGSTLQDYGPHTLTIAKAGYQTYIKKFTLSAKTIWEIKLAKAVNVLLNLGQPLLNLRPSDSENPNVMTL
jgi:hypothetical protein